jgi:hypothetical protein
MPVNNTTSLAGPFTPNGSTTIFPFAFNAQLASDVAVFDGNGALVSSALYTVGLYEGDGGTVTFSTAPTALQFPQLYIALVPSFAQTADFTNGGPSYNPAQLTATLDALASRIIALKGDVDRSLKTPLGEALTRMPAQATRAGKFLAFDAGGNPVAAGGTGADGTLRSDMAASGGAALVGKVGGGSLQNFIADTEAKFAETISVKDFGAVGNGVANDAPAFQAAVDFAAALVGGACIHVPAGQYRLNSAVAIAKSGTTFRGDGPLASWIVNGTTNAAALDFGDGTNSYTRNAVEGLGFGQASGVTPVAGNCAIRARKCQNLVVDKVQVFQFPAALYDGMVFDNVTQSYVTNIGLQACVNAAWVMRNNTFGIFATNGRCDTSAYGMHIRDCQGLYISNFDNFGNTISAFDIGNSGAGDTRYHFFTNCVGDTSGSHNWNITELEIGRFANCWAATQASQVTNPASDGFRLSGAGVVDIGFSNCVAISNNRHGINLDYATKVSVQGCTLGSNFEPAAFGGKGPANGLGSGGGSGIAVGASSSRIRINGGVFENNQRYGAEVASGAQKVDIFGAEMRDNVLGRILNNANATAAECKIANVGGFNPVGFITAPTVPASNTAITNLTGVDVMVYLTGGTLTGNVQIGGAGVAAFTNTGYYLPAGSTIRLTYSSAPTWTWSGV